MHKAPPNSIADTPELDVINGDEDSTSVVDIITLDDTSIETTHDKVDVNASNNTNIDIVANTNASHEKANHESASSAISSQNVSSETIKPAHVTTGSSLTPKGRLNKTPKLIANGNYAVRWYGLSLLVLIIDQWTKWLAETKLTFQEPVSVIEPILNWTLAYNYGAAFSFLADAGGWQKWFFAILALVMSVFLIGYLIKAPRQAKLLSLGLALVLGGAVGNLIDRLLHGHVIDFIHVHYADAWHYPIFNIADMGISIGVALIVIDMLFLEKKRQN